jgi:opacity protein-like surface antigen
MKKLCLLAVLLVLSMSVAAAAQDKPADNMNIVRDAIRAEKKVLVAENMGLTETEAAAFWPVYEEYQTEMKVIGDRMVKLIENYGTTHKVMTDDTAGKLLKEMLAIQADRVKLQEKYLPKFQKVLPMTKVARYYQIENKVRAVVEYDIASQIPLAEK